MFEQAYSSDMICSVAEANDGQTTYKPYSFHFRFV